MEVGLLLFVFMVVVMAFGWRMPLLAFDNMVIEVGCCVDIDDVTDD